MQFKHFTKKDIFSGIVVGLVSIPISMGYAQIAGLPPVYGLYGSLLPILIFALITSSRQFIVGVDAMPAAMVGGILAQMGIEAGSKEALCLVPAIALMVALWFVVLFLMKAGRIVKYISVPVMGGFISGVGLTIILMQLPKLYGGTAGTGEVTASGNYARKYHDTLDSNRELIAYAAMNLCAAFTGVCPVNGSVSRSGIADSMGTRSQAASVAASLTMLFVLLFGTGMLRFLPVPVLTGIVITALIGILEIPMAKKLWRSGKNELLVFMIAFLGVLFFGTLYGVVIGVLLSFGEVAVRAVVPPAAFVGRIPGHGNFYSLKRNSAARPVKNTIIYRFSGNLFFANADLFCDSIENAIKEDTHQVVVDARGIGSIDITATERIVQLYRSLKERGIYFYLTEHEGALNDRLRKMGGEILIEEGAVRRTITLALRDAGLEKTVRAGR